ncbi:MAG TPA: 50S ribosomal protein L25/general stress protein Ctc [Woeseiaceae bacterium]|nr:50S ribosomal protein L25/general stress protein Ctc [Woeseiaceae bacterium]
MKQEFNLIAEFRDDQGKGASRRLRHQGKVPAIIYGGGRPPRALTFDHNKILHQLDQEALYSSILTITVGDQSQAGILKDVQRHPAKRQIMHMDIQRVVEDEKIRMHVPIHIVGEQQAPGVKLGSGTVMRLITEVEVSCLPRDLPEYFEVDISALELDDMLHLSDIKVPEGVEITQLAYGEEHDHAIVSVHVVKAAAIEEEAPVEAVEPGEAKPEAAGEAAGEKADED